MLIEINNDFYNEILPLANSLNMTPGEYLKKQYDQQKNLKTVLLSEKDEFSLFLKEYQFLLDELFLHPENTFKSLNDLDHSHGMIEVFQELNVLLGQDVAFITKLYLVYKEQNATDIIV
ncbi:hypothetical protein [Desemzia incerta]|uniref:hypothetical protein n=1 Tax=Desemzia incerta TaxID=82801 RepID=UPI003314AAEC